jgi:flagellin
MSMRINTNVNSVFAQKHLSRTQDRLRSNFEHLSSGLRITKAADDAAGLALSEGMRAEIKSLHTAKRNTMDGISVVQTTEGALQEISDIISRMRELSVQASSDVLQATERAYLQTEFAAMQTEIDRIADSTTFNGLNLTNAATSVDVQVGAQNSGNDRIAITFVDANTTALAIGTANSDLDTAANARLAIDALDVAMDSLNDGRADLGAAQNRLGSAMAALENYTENLIDAESRIRDVDFAVETAELSRNQVFSQAGTSVLAQANQGPQAALALIQ